MSAFGKSLLLLSSRARQQYAGQISQRISDILKKNEASIKAKLGDVNGFILVTDSHPSKSDAKHHYTIDAYGKDEKHKLDKPIGCIHMYEDDTYQVFTAPRSKAWKAYTDKLPPSK
ncbi:hypothetical protein GYMLUDRAFT_60065 [Collybiopsis luxurians FD-317 M1]|uniref:Uncharacterized protein n=1 Tax=Collybiopsis luxurians FD-317 M1 TaxID=944289 RepID=A0A0D0B7R2_9AGAR|nr:hypothetical protein GYMLUDRAFT_60065 [Collybiopsis luxurians FD-317 M1]